MWANTAHGPDPAHQGILFGPQRVPQPCPAQTQGVAQTVALAGGPAAPRCMAGQGQGLRGSQLSLLVALALAAYSPWMPLPVCPTPTTGSAGQRRWASSVSVEANPGPLRAGYAQPS